MIEIPKNFIHASFFFTDIVGLSNPILSTSTQISKIRGLNESIAQCYSYKNTSEKEKIVLPTGDGMLIAFLTGHEKPIKLAKEIHEKLKNYNADKNQNEKIAIRIGCHVGDIFVVEDVKGQMNMWGSGSIMARRVMDFGDSGHILITSTMAEILAELSDEYRKIIHPLHDYQIKHGDVLLVYSVYNKSFGNPNKPKKGIIEHSKTARKISEKRNEIWYKEIKMNISLIEPQTKHIKISRTYSFSNQTEEPIYEIMNGVTTDIKKSLADLKIKSHDENEKELGFGRINLDTYYRKEFSVKLNTPVFQGDEHKEFTISYETEQSNRFFEDFMSINADSLLMKFNYPNYSDATKPKLYLFRYQDRERTQIDLKKGIIGKAEWDKVEEIKEKDIIRLEW